MQHGWRVRRRDVMVMMVARQVRMVRAVQVTQAGGESAADGADARRRHEVGDGRRDAHRGAIVQVVVVVMVVQVIVGVRLARRYVAIRCVVVVVRTRADEILKTQARRVSHLVESAAVHHWQRVERWKDLLVRANVNRFKSVLDTLAAEFRCGRHFLEWEEAKLEISRVSNCELSWCARARWGKFHKFSKWNLMHSSSADHELLKWRGRRARESLSDDNPSAHHRVSGKTNSWSFFN